MTNLTDTALDLVRPGAGILAADESIATMSTRLVAAGVPATAKSRRDYRELLLTTSRLSTWISGMIVCDETLRQTLSDGTPFPRAAADRGIRLGIKVDTGTSVLPFANGGLVTEGLDGLRPRLLEYRERGATFAKWRAVFDPTSVSKRTVRANAHALARYAALCQECGLVPIVEPEVLMDGAHEIALCQAVTANVLTSVFEHLALMGVDPVALVLKTNMVVAGLDDDEEESTADDIAARTVRVLRGVVPAVVPGVVFLSGGQSNKRACANLAAITAEAADRNDTTWRLTFSFGRALVDDALHIWRGDPAAVPAAQSALAANCARAAAATCATTDTESAAELSQLVSAHA
jgi:fructose-bisphosphate aldolase class I